MHAAAVPEDGAPCSAIVPRDARSGEQAIRLELVALTERSWVVLPAESTGDAPKDITTYVVRRGVVPAGSALRDAALLDAAAAPGAGHRAAGRDEAEHREGHNRRGRRRRVAMGDGHAPQRHALLPRP